jgi:hypothetical protein
VKIFIVCSKKIIIQKSHKKIYLEKVVGIKNKEFVKENLCKMAQK